MLKKVKLSIFAFAAITALSAVLFFCFYVRSFRTPVQPQALTAVEQKNLETILDSAFPARKVMLRNLPYKTLPAHLDIGAESAILIDTATGSILFEKNADEAIPPASMTKLVVMYIVFQEIAAGHISLQDIVPLKPESYACNLPSDSSLMFLNAGQVVTLEELLTGLAVDSGNDAAIAIALYISGSVDKFVERMNSEVRKLGLIHTHFTEPSGYSETNTTTAREFAAFSRKYVTEYPEALDKFHSRREFIYPLPENLPSFAVKKVHPIKQENTNKLLDILEGCDGLKTGFIYESGYNLALTVQRNGTRFLSVTMRGPGHGGNQGNSWRIHDGTALMEWAFSKFADFRSKEKPVYTVAVLGAKHKFVNLVPVMNAQSLTVPFITGKSPRAAADSVTVTAELPACILGGTQAGTIYGKLTYKLGTTVLEKIPLVADRSIKKAALPGYLLGKAASLFIR